MRRIIQREKQRQWRWYSRQKEFNNPYSVISGKTRKDRSTYQQAKSFLDINRVEAAYPLSDHEISNQDFYNYAKIKHLVGLFEYQRSPYWFRSFSVGQLLKIFDKWDAQIKALNTSHYLKLWIYENAFTDSQVVFGLNSRAERYTNMFESHEKCKAIPFLTKELESKLLGLDIAYCKDMFPLTAEDLSEISAINFISTAREMGYQIDPSLLLHKGTALEIIDSFIEVGFVEEIESDNHNFYICHHDNIWVIGKPD